MTRTRFRFAGLLLVAFIIASVLASVLARAAPPSQGEDPCAQCAEGAQLFMDGRYAEALPLLEAGFAGREKTTCADPDDMGICAAVLGFIRNR